MVIMLTAQGKTQGDLDCPNGQEDFCRYDDDSASDYLQNIPPENFEAFSRFFKNETLSVEADGMRSLNTREEPLCDSKESIWFPKRGRTVNNELKHIVNSGNYWQGIRVEVCLQNHSPCRFSDSFPGGFKAVCGQKSIYKELVTFEPNNPSKVLKTSLFPFPGCCVCRLQHV